MVRALPALLMALACAAAGQDGLVQALTGEPAAPAPLDPCARKTGMIHAGTLVAGRYHAAGPVFVRALRVVEHVRGHRLRVELVLGAGLGGVFAQARSADPRLVLEQVSELGTGELRVLARVEAQGATDDVVGLLSLRVEPRIAGRRVGRLLAVLGLRLVVGADPVDVARWVIQDDRWRWMEAGAFETDYERWLAGKLGPDALRSANCYQFVRYALDGAGVPERARPSPRAMFPAPDGKGGMVRVEREAIEEALAYQQGHRRGSPEVDQASMNRGLRAYAFHHAGQYRLAAAGYRPRRGDLVIYYRRDGGGSLQPMHVAMFTGAGHEIVHNRGRGPQTGSALGLVDRAWWDGIGVYEYVGATPIEGR